MDATWIAVAAAIREKYAPGSMKGFLSAAGSPFYLVENDGDTVH
jgi:hypothetical protein